MDQIEEFNRSWFLSINGVESTPVWLVNLAIAIGDHLIYLIPLLLLWMWLWGNTARRNLAVKACFVAILGVGANQAIALVWQHPRPFVMGLGHAWLAHTGDSSFPSDHATVFAGVGLSLLLAGAWGLAGMVLLTGLLVAWARVFLGVHFPLDMLGAAVVAAVAYAIVTPPWNAWGKPITSLAECVYRKLLAWPISAHWIRN